MSQLIDRPTAQPPTDRPATAGPRGGRRLLLAAATGSLGAAAAGGAALLGHRPGFTAADAALARGVLSPAATTALLVAVALLGLAAAVLGLARPASSAVRTAVTAVAAVEVVVTGIGLQSIGSIALAGYLFAMALPFGALWVAVQAIRHYRRLRLGVLAALATLAASGVRSGPLQPTHVAALARDLGRGFATNSGELLTTVLLAGLTACWTLLSIALLRNTAAAARVSGWVLSHRRGVTVLAAAGPLPYTLIRASWLTPWPLLSPGGETLTPEIRLWGLLLGAGAMVGSVLTVGLIRPWGVTFPRWMPRLAGRRVPVAAATVPGGLVAGILCASAAPMLRGILFPEPGTVFGQLPLLERLTATVIFPFWCWGPALALAVWGYALSRRPAPRAARAS